MGKHRFVGDHTGKRDRFGNLLPGEEVTPPPGYEPHPDPEPDAEVATDKGGDEGEGSGAGT